MTQFDDAKFEGAVRQAAGEVRGEAPAAVPGDFITPIIDLVMQLLSGCLSPKPGPTPTPAAVAASLKNASGPQRNYVKRHLRRQYASRDEADKAFAAMMKLGETPAGDIEKAVDDTQADLKTVPDFDLI